MRDRAEGALSLRTMAEIAQLSPYHFARTFRRVTGIPPGEIQTTVRLERAKQLLLTTDLSVTGVCFEVGYESLGTFTTRFTQLVGLSPTRWSRRSKNQWWQGWIRTTGSGSCSRCKVAWSR
jgi:AraC family transcriptional regulator